MKDKTMVMIWMVTRVTHHIAGDSFILSDNCSSQNRMCSCDLRRQISVSHKPRIQTKNYGKHVFPRHAVPWHWLFGVLLDKLPCRRDLINTDCLYSPFPFKRGPTNVWVFFSSFWFCFVCPHTQGFACLCSQIIVLERLWSFLTCLILASTVCDTCHFSGSLKIF